jgi:hypothetical protein
LISLSTSCMENNSGSKSRVQRENTNTGRRKRINGKG